MYFQIIVYINLITQCIYDDFFYIIMIEDYKFINDYILMSKNSSHTVKQTLIN